MRDSRGKHRWPVARSVAAVLRPAAPPPLLHAPNHGSMGQGPVAVRDSHSSARAHLMQRRRSGWRLARVRVSNRLHSYAITIANMRFDNECGVAAGMCPRAENVVAKLRLGNHRRGSPDVRARPVLGTRHHFRLNGEGKARVTYEVYGDWKGCAGVSGRGWDRCDGLNHTRFILAPQSVSLFDTLHRRLLKHTVFERGCISCVGMKSNLYDDGWRSCAAVLALGC